MKRKSLLIMLLVALCVPLAMNAQTKALTKKTKKVSTELKMKSASDAKPYKVASLMTLSNDRGDRGDRATYTYSFSSIPTSGWSTNGGTKTINNIDWTYSSSTYIGATATRIQVGSKNNPQASNWTIQTPISSFGQNVIVTGVSITGYVTQNASSSSYSISVNGNTVKSGNLTTSSATYSATNLNYTSGNIVVTLKGSSSPNTRALYLSNIQVTYEIPSCDEPTSVTVSATPSAATVSWEGDCDSYNLRYRELSSKFTYDFESATPFAVDEFSPCTTYDGDGSGTYGIQDLEFTNQQYTGAFIAFQNDVVSSLNAHGGNAFGACFAATTPPNNDFFILPSLTIETGDVFSFWAKQYTDSYPEAFRVGVYGANGSLSSYLAGSASTSITPTTTWTQYSYDLSAYNGQTIQLAIQCVSNDAFIFCIDDISVLSGSWNQTITGVTSPYTIEGLTEGTSYEVQVQGVCSGLGESDWSSNIFSTPSYCDLIPTDLTVELTSSSAELSWTGYHDSYNVQYRIPAFDGYYINEPLTPDNIGDWGSLYADDNSSFYYTDDTQTDVCWVFSYNTNPPQYLFSPDFPRPTQHSETLTFDYKVASATYPETFELLYIVGDDVVAEDAVTVSNTDWEQYTSEVPVGATSFVIAYLSNDMYRLYLDNFVISSDDPVTEGTDWMTATANGNTLSLGFTQLESESIYEWQVQGVDCDGEGNNTDWSYSSFFTTPEIAAVPVESITVNPTEIEMNVGATYSIVFTVLPEDATNTAVTFSSADESVATVNENGVVTGVAAGTTTITIAATDGSGVTGTLTVTVTNIDVEEINVVAYDITIITGETATIEYTVLPANATDLSVTFTSANTAIATVDAEGVVTGVSVGTTTITITSVSNPDITAEINVTVTSNPNAVQFTVNAPANAAPGDFITVEGVLTAPTSGTWNGFTGLILDITYDNTAFEYVANSQVYGPVATKAQQNGAFMMPGTLANAVQLAMIISDNNNSVSTEGVVFSAQFTVLAETGEYTFTAVPHEGNLSYDVELLPYEATSSTVVVAEPVIEQYFKPIAGWSNAEEGASNFYLIASPIGDIAPTAVTIEGDATANMVSSIGSYDLYYFDHNRDLEWVNYIDANNNPGAFSLLESGKGYLYANLNDVTLVFTGTGRHSGEETIPLAYYEEGDGFTIDLPGWNLLGNPFAETAYLTTSNSGITTNFYTMDAYGVYLPVTNGSIEAMEGVFVHAEGEGQSVTFTTTAPSKSPVLNLNLSNGRRVVDRAIVRFDRGNQLPKLQFRQGSTKVYIPVEGHDYAVVSCEEMGELPVSFKAEENGSYNLSLSSEEVSFAYLHLIDNMTGADVDLLQTPSYSFEAKTTDYESRFKLVFATGDNSNDDNFAFFSNGSFVINNDGEATLQVIDVTGRILSSESINGCTNVNVNAASGVYMLRLINGDNVKVQKVVVK